MAENNIEQGEVVDDDDENEALKEIVNNEWMRGLEDCHQNRCKVALELWKEKDKLFTDRIDRKKKQSLDSQNEVYQLIGFYVVFQGVLVTAVAQSSLLHCNNTWTAALLSALASFVTVIGVTLKLGSVKELERTIGQEENTRSVMLHALILRRVFHSCLLPDSEPFMLYTYFADVGYVAIATLGRRREVQLRRVH